MDPVLDSRGLRGSSLLESSIQYLQSRRLHFEASNSNNCVKIIILTQDSWI